MNYCKRCLFPETKPDLYFDDVGVCDACRSAETKWVQDKMVNWDRRSEEFEAIIASLPRKGAYDCVVPVSGGKDSTFQTYEMVKKHNLKTLAVTFDQFDQTPTGLNNLEVLKEIGVDHLHFTLNPHVLKRMVLRGFEEIGDLYWVNHVGIFSLPTRVATWLDIPLVVYGENPQFEYGGPPENRKPQPMNERWRQEFGGLRGLREDDLIEDGISERDVEILRFPDEKDCAGISGIFYGDYFRWDPINHTKFIQQFGWTPLSKPPCGSSTSVENCDMQFIDIREHIKFLKFGYGRATDQLNIQIRAGDISRYDALKIAKEIDGDVSPENIDRFCEYIDISRQYFDILLERFVNKKLFEKTENGWRLKVERH